MIMTGSPYGRDLTRRLAGLPKPSRSRRWNLAAKAKVVSALAQGALTAEEIEAIYGVPADELAQWSDAVARNGFEALRITRNRPKRVPGLLGVMY